MITDKMLTQAAAELADAINESLPAPSECTHQFSPRFEKKMKRLIRRANHPTIYRALRSVASILLVIMIGFGSTLAVSAEAREIVFGWLKQQYENFYEYFFEGEVEPTESAKYQPGWLPEGCDFVTSYEIPGGEVYVYTNERESLFQFTYTSNTDTTKAFVEGVEYIKEDVLVNGLPGEIYLATNQTETNGIVWTNTDDNTLFFVSGDFTEDELIKIAESIVKNN